MLTPEMAVLEASRCLQSKKPSCVEGCPVSVKIPEFIRLIAEKDFSGTTKTGKKIAFPCKIKGFP